jgi:hypothetical protein
MNQIWRPLLSRNWIYLGVFSSTSFCSPPQKEMASLFVPYVEDGWRTRISSSDAAQQLTDKAEGVHVFHLLRECHHTCHDDTSEQDVSESLAAARRVYLLTSDAAEAYRYLAPLCESHLASRQRRELEDCAIELLVEVGNAEALARWLPPVEHDMVHRAQDASSKRVHHSRNNKALLIRGLSRKEFMTSLNAADVGQRMSVLACLARGQAQAISGNIIPDDARYRWGNLALCGFVEGCSALLRKQLRRDLFIWKQIVNTLEAALSVQPTSLLCASPLVGRCLVDYVRRVVLPCLQFRDRPVESAARSYGLQRGYFEGRHILSHCGHELQLIRDAWVAAHLSSEAFVDDEGERRPTERQESSETVVSVVERAMLDIMRASNAQTMTNDDTSSSGASTPRDCSAPPRAPVEVIVQSGSLTEAIRGQCSATDTAHFLTVHVFVCLASNVVGVDDSAEFVAEVAQRVGPDPIGLSASHFPVGTAATSPWAVMYDVVFRMMRSYLVPPMESVFGQLPKPCDVAAGCPIRKQ